MGPPPSKGAATTSEHNHSKKRILPLVGQAGFEVLFEVWVLPKEGLVCVNTADRNRPRTIHHAV